MGPQWKSDEELEIKGALEAKCKAVGEGPNTVDKGCKATDRGNVFPGAHIVDRDHDFDNGDERVKD